MLPYCFGHPCAVCRGITDSSGAMRDSARWSRRFRALHAQLAPASALRAALIPAEPELKLKGPTAAQIEHLNEHGYGECTSVPPLHSGCG